jgi:hypothetical protein
MEAQNIPDPAWPTRQDVADQLRVCERTVRRWEQSGRLKVKRDASGTHRIDPHSLASLVLLRERATRDSASAVPHQPRALDDDATGRFMGRAFEAYSQGRSRREVVMQLHVAPSLAAQAYEHWIAFGDDIVLREEDRRDLTRLGVTVSSSADIIRTLRALLRVLDAYGSLLPPCACGCGRPVPLAGSAAGLIRREAGALGLQRRECWACSTAQRNSGLHHG